MASIWEILALTRSYNKLDAEDYVIWRQSGTIRFAIANDGELQLPNATAAGQALLLGGDAEIYRSAASTLTFPAMVLSGAVTGGGQSISNLSTVSFGSTGGLLATADNTFVGFRGSTNTAGYGAFLTVTGKSYGHTGAFLLQTPDAAGTADVLRLKIDGVAAIVTSAWSNIYHTGMKFGLAGTATGAWTMDGATSGVVTMTVAATAGTWTMTLPATAGTSGYFLVSNGSGVTSWSNTLTSPTINGTIATTGLTMPAFNSGTISLDSNDHIISNYGSLISHVSDTDNINLCGGTDTNGGYIVLTGKSHASLPGRVTIYTPNAALSATTRVTFLGAADTTAITWGNSYHTGMKFGLAGTATGAFTMDGATSGVLTVTVPAATTSYTLTLPAAANTNAGYQLTCAGADTITSWAAAASKREYKNILGLADPQTSLDLILNTKTYKFHYKPGMGTGDVDTEYVGFVAEERPEFTHYKNGVLNPINTFGHTALAIQALNNRIEELEKQVIILSGR